MNISSNLDMKRIGVVGSINLDTVVAPRGSRVGLGGILYTALALAYLGKGQIEVWLFSKIGRDIAEDVKRVVESCSTLRMERVEVVSVPNYRSHIRYLPDGGKEERLTGSMGIIAWEDLIPFVGSLDGLLVNFITGFELSLEGLRALKQHGRGPLLMDVHSLTLGRKSGNERFWKKPAHWQDWLAQADLVQMNEAEARLLGDIGRTSFVEQRLRDFAVSLLSLGPWGVVITRGEKGALGVYEKEGGEIGIVDQPAEPSGREGDATGCGDVFLAALGKEIVMGSDFACAVRRAVKVAGWKSRVSGIEHLSRLADVEFI